MVGKQISRSNAHHTKQVVRPPLAYALTSIICICCASYGIYHVLHGAWDYLGTIEVLGSGDPIQLEMLRRTARNRMLIGLCWLAGSISMGIWSVVWVSRWSSQGIKGQGQNDGKSDEPQDCEN
jgi:hypothetical protein